jgi:hypothetical protein
VTNPIELFENLRDTYLRYLDSPYDLRYADLVAERRTLLDVDGRLYREPLIEPVRARPGVPIVRRHVFAGGRCSVDCLAPAGPGRSFGFCVTGPLHADAGQWQPARTVLAPTCCPSQSFGRPERRRCYDRNGIWKDRVLLATDCGPAGSRIGQMDSASPAPGKLGLVESHGRAGQPNGSCAARCATGS